MKIKINGTPQSVCNCETGNAAMVFIEPQKIDGIYSASDAFICGTLFPELSKPFSAGGC